MKASENMLTKAELIEAMEYQSQRLNGVNPLDYLWYSPGEILKTPNGDSLTFMKFDQLHIYTNSDNTPSLYFYFKEYPSQFWAYDYNDDNPDFQVEWANIHDVREVIPEIVPTVRFRDKSDNYTV